METVVFTIAGSDPSGGAGIQQDIRVFTCLGLYACAAVTALTVQNTNGVKSVYPVDGKILGEQVQAVLEDIHVSAIKIGMLATRENVAKLAASLDETTKIWVVADPVMRSSTGSELLEEAAWRLYQEELLPFIDILTPNIFEAGAITSLDIHSVLDMEEAARLIYLTMEKKRYSEKEFGVYLKGGHLKGTDQGVDVFCSKKGIKRLYGRRIQNIHTHGTGCTLSSAICGYLARGEPIEKAIRLSKEFVTKAIKAGFPLGKGIGPVDPLIFLK